MLLDSFCEFEPTVTPFVGTELLDVFVSLPLFNVPLELPSLDPLLEEPLEPLVLDPVVLFEDDPFELEPFDSDFDSFELDLSFFLDDDFALSTADIVLSEPTPPAPILDCKSLKADKLFNILIVLIAEFRPISIPVEIPIIDPHGLLLPYVL